MIKYKEDNERLCYNNQCRENEANMLRAGSEQQKRDLTQSYENRLSAMKRVQSDLDNQLEAKKSKTKVAGTPAHGLLPCRNFDLTAKDDRRDIRCGS